MKNNLWTYSGQLYTHSNSNILSVLDKIAAENSCLLVYENIETNNKKGITINYKYKGEKNNIDLVQKDINDLKYNIAHQHLHHYFRKHTVNSVEECMAKNELNMKINVNKISSFMEIAQAVALELNISTNVYEQSLGFLKGKDVNIKVTGDSKELILYKNLINEFIENPKTKKIKFN